MKKYAFLILTCIFMLSFAATTQAQNPNQGNNPGMRQGNRQMGTPAERVERLAKDISLNDEQKAKILAMYEKYDASFAKLRTDLNRESPDFRTKMTEMREAQDKELKEIIGEEKFEQLAKIRAERRNNNTNNNR